MASRFERFKGRNGKSSWQNGNKPHGALKNYAERAGLLRPPRGEEIIYNRSGKQNTYNGKRNG